MHGETRADPTLQCSCTAWHDKVYEAHKWRSGPHTSHASTSHAGVGMADKTHQWKTMSGSPSPNTSRQMELWAAGMGLTILSVSGMWNLASSPCSS